MLPVSQIKLPFTATSSAHFIFIFLSFLPPLTGKPLPAAFSLAGKRDSFGKSLLGNSASVKAELHTLLEEEEEEEEEEVEQETQFKQAPLTFDSYLLFSLVWWWQLPMYEFLVNFLRLLLLLPLQGLRLLIWLLLLPLLGRKVNFAFCLAF